MDASLSLSAPTPEIPVIPKKPQRLLPSPPPTAPIPVSWKYKDCNDCTRLKKRCRSHRIRPPTNRTKPGKVCVRCKAKKRACPGFPCRRCEKAGKVCESCPPSGGTARSIASTGAMDIDTDALDDTDDVKVAGRGDTPVAMASEDAPWLFPNLNGGTIGGWNESASNSGNFNMGSPGYSSVPSSSNNSSIPSSPFTGSMGNEMFIPGMSPEALPSVPSWITGVNDAQSEEDDFSRYTEIMNDSESRGHKVRVSCCLEQNIECDHQYGHCAHAGIPYSYGHATYFRFVNECPDVGPAKGHSEPPIMMSAPIRHSPHDSFSGRVYNKCAAFEDRIQNEKASNCSCTEEQTAPVLVPVSAPVSALVPFIPVIIVYSPPGTLPTQAITSFPTTTDLLNSPPLPPPSSPSLTGIADDTKFKSLMTCMSRQQSEQCLALLEHRCRIMRHILGINQSTRGITGPETGVTNEVVASDPAWAPQGETTG
ncbi:hypothetical protein BC938DRAFT_475790 [Jimgerdemannia flammicorona]|uniref:Zn(2)-C6 fungal-type domain-containing protein n=1 Tax=Jimgerdemannia flammicorona TaxID=994334 RepID=A0A433QR93_9FUNG|nr:hypothetical protein BC938DRAFT_475790 [Jimgerdemannia flammicorona]